MFGLHDDDNLITRDRRQKLPLDTRVMYALLLLGTPVEMLLTERVRTIETAASHVRVLSRLGVRVCNEPPATKPVYSRD